MQIKLTRRCGPKVLKLSSTGSDLFPKVLKLSFEVSECQPLDQVPRIDVVDFMMYRKEVGFLMCDKITRTTRRGLTLLHFSAQLQPCQHPAHPKHPLTTP